VGDTSRVSLAPGTRLGAYEILALLGAGGMGEVYRARDVRIDRAVALKMLPEEFFEGEETRQRFEREARMLASLNHPGIATLYSFEEIPGPSSSSSRHLLVMELVEGESLERKTASGALSLEESLSFARQIAEALEAAHERGVVHRDLKPANVMVSVEGRIKLLDFGLAKAFEADPSSPDISHSPTLTARGTAAGMILGTAAYMSPEQARGKPVDKRSDIWAFGVVLYEMLAGKRLFRGETVSDTLAAVLREPVDWTRLPAATPRNVHNLLARCLERDPRERLRDIGEARIALEHPSDAFATRAASESARPSAGRWLPWAVAALAVTATAYALLHTKGPGAHALASPRVFQQLTYQPGWELLPSLSPDGTSLVYVSGAAGRPDIYFQRVGGQNAISLTKDLPAESTEPAFSPSGDSIAFRSARDGGGIFLMGATGENIRRLTDFGFNPAWSPDGTRLALSSQAFPGHPFARKGYGDLWTVDVASGKKELLLKGEVRAHSSEGDAMQPSWSPHGYRIAYWGLRGQTGRRNIWTIPAEGGPTRSVTDGPATDWNPIWSPDGKYLYFGSDRSGSLNLWRVAIDERSGKTLTDPEPVTLPATWAGLFAIRQAFGLLDSGGSRNHLARRI